MRRDRPLSDTGWGRKLKGRDLLFRTRSQRFSARRGDARFTSPVQRATMVFLPSLRPTASQQGEADSPSYRPPDLLRSLHVLDFWELLGNQSLAAQALQLHQSSVSRIVTDVSQQFKLRCRTTALPSPHPLRYLRLAYRAHRMGEGVLRLATDPLLQPLLDGLPSLQSVPPRFRSIQAWVGLLQEGVIDAALVLAPDLEPVPPGPARPWDGVGRCELGCLELQLAVVPGGSREVLVPELAQAPLLHRQLSQRQWRLRQFGVRREPAQAWQESAERLGLVLPVIPSLLPDGWLTHSARSLEPLSPPLRVPLWLLSGEEAMVSSTLHQGVGRLRQQWQKQ